MCFRRKKVKKRKRVLKEPVFFIPQIIKPQGLRKRTGFVSEQSISAVFGRHNKDGFNPQNKINDTKDTAERYDAFRAIKKISDEEYIKKYGTKYHEFTAIHTDASREKYLGSKVYNPDLDEQAEQEALLKPITNNYENDILDKLNEQFANDPKLNISIDTKLAEAKPIFDYEFNPIPDYLKSNGENPSEDKFEEDTNYTKFDDGIFKTEEDNKAGDEQSSEATLEKPAEVGENPTEESDEIIYDSTNRPKTLSRLPSLDRFSVGTLNLNDKPQWLLEHINAINETLKEFGIEGYVVGHTKGPTVTRYEVDLERGTNVKRVSQIKDNIMMNLKAKQVRILTPIPGKSYVGIEVANVNPDIVLFGNCVANQDFLRDDDHPLNVVLGLDIDGNYIYSDIEKMPHCLIAGATNSGKSVCVNTILTSLLVKNTADDLRLILIDPKVVELKQYDGLPHLITPVITKPEVAAAALKWAVLEMEARYNTLADNMVKDIRQFNEKVINGDISGAKMPYIVIVIDELADLMMTAATEVETAIKRISQKARAAGIHLIVATQRPTTDVINGIIKGNITTRIAFRVASHTDSVVILGQVGAETLLGNGDMLYSSNDGILRLQGAFIPNDEIYNTIEYIKNNEQPNYKFLHSEITKPDDNQFRDELFISVAKYVVREQIASINAIQKEFSIGYNRAQRIMDLLEEYKVVSHSKGTKPREVLMGLSDLRDIFKLDE